MPQPPKPPGDQITIRGSLNALFIVMSVHARSVQPFMRDKIGAKAQGLYSVIAGVLMFYASLLAGDQFFFYFVVAWFVMTIAQRVDSGNYRKRHQVHSQYSGRPALANLLGFKDEGFARLVVEPLICFAAGAALSHWSMNVAKLVGTAGLSLMLLEQMTRRFSEGREQAVMDARIEQEQLAQGVRDKWGS